MNLLALVPWWGRALALIALAGALFGYGYTKGLASCEADSAHAQLHQDSILFARFAQDQNEGQAQSRAHEAAASGVEQAHDQAVSDFTAAAHQAPPVDCLHQRVAGAVDQLLGGTASSDPAGRRLPR